MHAETKSKKATKKSNATMTLDSKDSTNTQQPAAPFDPTASHTDDEDMILAAELEGPVEGGDNDAMAMETDELIPEAERPNFPPLKPRDLSKLSRESRSIPIPPHRLTPLKKSWMQIYSPLVEHMKLQVRMNVKKKCVEIRTCAETEDAGAVQKGADFVKAFALGFDIADSMAMLRLDDIYIETFETRDVKTLNGDNLSRAVGRIVGKDGRTKFAIENASRTRIVVADCKIHIMGSFSCIRIARDALVALILGASPGKVYNKLRIIANRQKERF